MNLYRGRKKPICYAKDFWFADSKLNTSYHAKYLPNVETSSAPLNFKCHYLCFPVVNLSSAVVNNLPQVTKLGSDGAWIPTSECEVKNLEQPVNR